MVDSTIEMLLSEIKDDDHRMTVMSGALNLLAEKISASETHAILANALAQAEENLEEPETSISVDLEHHPHMLDLSGLDEDERDMIIKLAMLMLNYKTVVKERDCLSGQCSEPNKQEQA